MEITFILLFIIVAVVAFFIGKRFASKPIEDRNEEIRQQVEEQQKELDKLQFKIQMETASLNTYEKLSENKKAEIQQAEERIAQVKKQYQDSLNTIANTEKLAKEKYEAKSKEYTRLLEDEQSNFKENLEFHKQELKKAQEELDSLKATKAAAIEAARKEQLVHKKQEDYCLRIPMEEQSDVTILQGIKNKITKPRAVSMIIWSNYYQPIAKKLFPQILGSQEVCGIYKITNQETNECYIGQARDVRRRWFEHCKHGLSIDTPQGNKLYKAMQDYGLEHFSFELLEECPAEKLNEKERYFIELYAADTLGYNSVKGVK